MRHLPAKRRKTSPTAIGRTPPCGLGGATRPAPADRSNLRTGLSLCSRLTKPAKCSCRLLAAPGGPASRKCCARRPHGPGALSQLLQGNLIGQREGINVHRWHGLDRVQSPQRRDAFRSVGAEAGSKKGVAGFTVKALRGHSKLLIKQAVFWGWLLETVVPKTTSLTFGIALQAINCVGCSSTAVPATNPWRGAQHTLREHKQFGQLWHHCCARRRRGLAPGRGPRGSALQ